MLSGGGKYSDDVAEAAPEGISRHGGGVWRRKEWGMGEGRIGVEVGSKGAKDGGFDLRDGGKRGSEGTHTSEIATGGVMPCLKGVVFSIATRTLFSASFWMLYLFLASDTSCRRGMISG